MTPEQKKVIDRCGAMLRRAFPLLEGKVLFRFQKGKRYAEFEYAQYGSVRSEDGDVVFQEQGATVDLRG